MADQRSLEAAREVERRFDVFVNVKGITGESTDAKHMDWMEALGVVWGVRQPSGTGQAGSLMERADFDHLTITKVVERSSPMLYRFCAQGTVVPEVRVEMCEQAREHVNFLTIILEEAHVVSARLTGEVSLDGPPRPLEEIGFIYGKIKWEYVCVSHDGERGAKTMAGWDLNANRPQ